MKELFQHKKFRAALLASLAAFLGEYAAALATTYGDFWQALSLVNWTLVTAPWMVAIGAQGIADHGKERAKVETSHAKARDERLES
jgi:hypothetical protein